MNKLYYQIYDGKYGKSNMKTVETGSFVIEVNSEVREYKRDIEWRKNLYFVTVVLLLNTKSKPFIKR